MQYVSEVVKPEVGDLIELIKQPMNSFRGSRAIVLDVLSEHINIRWIGQRGHPPRNNQDNGQYNSEDFKLIERM